MSLHRGSSLAALLALCVAAAGHAASPNNATAVEAARVALRTRQPTLAVTLLQAPAAAGNADAQYLLGLINLNGVGIAPDAAAAERWLRAAAEQGQAPAAFALAALLAQKPATEGTDGAALQAEAVSWLHRSADLGYVRAQAALKDPAPLMTRVRASSGHDFLTAWVLYCARHDDAAALRQVGATAVQVRDDFARDALSQAADALAEHAVQALLTLGANARSADQFGTTALMLAAQGGNMTVIRALLAGGADANQVDAQRRSSLYYAVRADKTDALQALLGAGGRLDSTDSRGYTLLDIAMNSGAANTAAALRTRGVRPSLAAVVQSTDDGHIDASRPGDRYRGWPALALAVSRDDQATVDKLLADGASVQQRTPEGDPLWRVAVDAGATQTLRILMDHGLDALVPDHTGRTALVYCASGPNSGMLATLLAANVNADAHAPAEESPLLVAVRNGQTANAKLLLDAGARVETTDSAGHTAQMFAARSADGELLRLLLAHSARVDTSDKLGRTALWYAADAGSLPAVEELLAARSAFESADVEGMTPLAIAAQTGHLTIVSRLMAAGARPDAINRRGDSTLILAASAGHSDVVGALLRLAGPLDRQNIFGDTALIAASRAGQLVVCRTLVAAGASKSVRNGLRATAADVARERGFEQIVQLLDSKS